MICWKKLQHSNFYTRLVNWEYWPFGIVQFPFFIYWLWLSLRARSFLFFSASNPGIPMGGMFGESKYDVLSLIPQRYKPQTFFIKANASPRDVLNVIENNKLNFPLIFKPDLGERGFMVKKIFSHKEAEEYSNKLQKDFLIQEFLDLPLEYGIFYTKMPNESKGSVTSVVVKDMLTVRGDGKSTLSELILSKPRAKLQWKKLKHIHVAKLSEVLSPGEVFLLNAIGNHSLGTTFLNGEYLINNKLSETFDAISTQIDGFCFGRYDLRCASVEDLYKGNIKIMELNGCGAEPAHIYHPGFPLLKAMQILFKHWKNMFMISVQNHRKGAPYTSLKDGMTFYKKFKSAIH